MFYTNVCSPVKKFNSLRGRVRPNLLHKRSEARPELKQGERGDRPVLEVDEGVPRLARVGADQDVEHDQGEREADEDAEQQPHSLQLYAGRSN